MRQLSRSFLGLTFATLCLAGLPHCAGVTTVNFDNLATRSIITSQFQAQSDIAQVEVFDFVPFRDDGFGLDKPNFLMANASVPGSPPRWIIGTGLLLLALVKYARGKRSFLNRAACLAERTLHLRQRYFGQPQESSDQLQPSTKAP